MTHASRPWWLRRRFGAVAGFFPARARKRFLLVSESDGGCRRRWQLVCEQLSRAVCRGAGRAATWGLLPTVIRAAEG